MSLRLQLAGVSKHFGNNAVLSHIDLSVHAGEVVALLGDNGAGKSTLIKIISGYHPPSAGTMHWEGKLVDPTHFSPKRAQSLGIQTVYQHLGLVEKLSIARNFFLGKEPKKKRWGIQALDMEFMNTVVTSQLQSMKIARRLKPDTPVSYLSGGEKQAVAIARARYFGARLLILDEPTSALSLNQTQEVLNLIVQAKQQGVAVVFITHSLHHIKDIVDTVFIMSKGRMVQKLSAPIDEKACALLIMASARV